MTRPPSSIPDTKTRPRLSHDTLAEQMADYEREHGKVEESPHVPVTVESIKQERNT